MKYLLGADIGTTSLKAALFDEEGNLLFKDLEPNDPPRGVDDMMQLALKTAVRTEL